MLNVEMYTQMGFSEKLVEKAHEYSKKNGVDMFDALQKLQQAERTSDNKKLKDPPNFSYLKHVKNIRLSDYQVIYGRSVVKNSHLEREQIREVNNPVGLLNVSNCCYLNSLLQCYFLMGSFVRQILIAEPISDLPETPENRVKIKRVKSQYALLQVLKQMFARMKLSSKKYINPLPILKNLVDSVGQKIEYGDEKDLHETNMSIVERLSECLMFTKKYYSRSSEEISPSKTKQKENIKKLFYGEKVQFTEGSQEIMENDFMGIILNPTHSNLMSALDSEFNYEVEIDNKIVKKKNFIKTVPEFLFFNINRINYEKGQKQFMKNYEKMSFDFVIYLDRYMEKNKEEAKVMNPIIIELRKRKNQLQRQLNHLKILTTKLDQCRDYARSLSGWLEKLPKKEQLIQQKQQFDREIQKIEKQLQKIESRKEKFVLLYLFVHRGDAMSGHYWGYGRNGNNWYRFDINCSHLKESQILVDMERSGGTPYALVYAQDSHIQSFAYPYHLKIQEGQQIFGIGQSSDYSKYVSSQLKKKIISQNQQIHDFIDKRKIQIQLEKIIKQYRIKYNLVKAECENSMGKQIKIPNYTNFACFLESSGLEELMKYHVFSLALFHTNSMTTQQLLNEERLLNKIQKKFRKKMKGKMALRHFAIQKQPGQGQKYKTSMKKYLLGKKFLKFINYIQSNIENWPKIPQINECLGNICKNLQKPEVLYLKNLVQELVPVLILDLGKSKQVVYEQWLQPFKESYPLLKQQLKCFGTTIKSQGDFEKATILHVEIQTDWQIQDLKRSKGDYEIIEKVKKIVLKLKQSYEIYRMNLKEKKLDGVQNQQLI